MAKRLPRERPREVDLIDQAYQPSKAELEADLRVNANFEKAVDALARPVRIRYIGCPKPE